MIQPRDSHLHQTRSLDQLNRQEAAYEERLSEQVLAPAPPPMGGDESSAPPSVQVRALPPGDFFQRHAETVRQRTAEDERSGRIPGWLRQEKRA